eukprot:g4315.t1
MVVREVWVWALFVFLHFTSCGCVSIASSARRSFRGNIKSEGKGGETSNSIVFTGDGKYRAGNFVPGHKDGLLKEKGQHLQNQKYWANNPYFSYFKRIWGNAPFLDSNFRLWMSGAFKNFKVGSHPQKFQTTKALPAYLHYFGREYDPLVDPPYPSEEALYSDTKEFIHKISENEYKNSKGAIEDCSQAFGPSALGYKRPCNVNKFEAGSYSKAKDDFQLNKILGKNSWHDGEHRAAGSGQGSTLYANKQLPPSSKPYDEKEAKGKFYAVDDKWIKADSMKDRVNRGFMFVYVVGWGMQSDPKAHTKPLSSAPSKLQDEEKANGGDK